MILNETNKGLGGKEFNLIEYRYLGFIIVFLFLTLFTSLLTAQPLGIDAEKDGPVYGTHEALLRVKKLEDQLHNMEIREDHPRIFLTNETLSKYRKRITEGHPAWGKIKALADGGDLINAAFAYIMLKDSNPGQANTYADIVIQAIKNINESECEWYYVPLDVWNNMSHGSRKTQPYGYPINIFATHQKVGEMALAFDWIYDALSNEDKNYIIQKISTLAAIDVRYEALQNGTYRSHGEATATATFHREDWAYYAWQAWPEIALAHHNIKANELYYSRWNYDSFWGDAARIYAYLADGTPLEGYYAGPDGVGWFLALKSATSINLIDGELGWAKNNGYYYLHRIDIGNDDKLPYRREVFHRGMGNGGAGLITFHEVGGGVGYKKALAIGRSIALVAEENPYAQWLLKNKFAWTGTHVSATIFSDEYVDWNGIDELTNIAELLFYDPNNSTKAPEQVTYSDISYGKAFKGGKEVYMRNGFTKNSAIAGFRATDPFAITCHMDFEANSFFLYRKGQISGNTGLYDVEHGYYNYYWYQKLTTAHNSILVIDPSTPDEPKKLAYQAPDPGGTRSDWALNWGVGGYQYSHRQSAHWAELSAFVSSPDYDYAVGDAAKAYSDRVDEFKRKVVFLRKEDTKAFFIVFDKVQTKDEKFKKKWLMHFVAEPNVNGSKISEEIPNHIDTYDGDLTIAENAYGDAAVYIKTLLPSQHSIRRVGGAGYEFYIEGTNPQNHPPTSGGMEKCVTEMGGVEDEVGTWRIELQPQEQSKLDLFFNVMYLGNVGEAMPNIERINSSIEGLMEGAYIQDSTEPWLVMFAAEKDSVSHVLYNINNNISVGHLICDLPKNSNYQINVNGTLNISGQTSSQGTIYFKHNPNGTAEYEIYIGETSVKGKNFSELPQKLSLQQNYPNPFNDSTIIPYYIPQCESNLSTSNTIIARLNIYNISGQLIRTLLSEEKKSGSYQVIWDGRDNRGVSVGSGVYFYALEFGKQVEKRKLIFLR